MIVGNGAETRRMAEQSFREASVELPEGYSSVGLAIAADSMAGANASSRLFITGPDVPAMFWDGSQWVRVIDDLDG
jgi:hypothetical protein